MDCPSCGAINPASASFCSLCLKRLEDAQVDTALGQIPASESGGASDPLPPQGEVTATAAPTPPWLQSESAPTDVEAQADAYLAAAGSDGYSIPEPALPERSARGSIWTRQLLPGAGRLGLLLKIGVWPIAFILGITIWILSGGWASMEAGKVASIPLPAGTVLLGTLEKTTEGPMGPLSAERRQIYATRVFAVPMDSDAALAYYTTGAGATALKADGWVGPARERGAFSGNSWQWTRVASMGYRANEEQEIDLWFGGASMARDLKGVPVPAGSSVVRVVCFGIGVKRLEFPTK